MRARHLLEAGAFAALLTAARLLPRRLLLAVGSGAGLAGWALDARHRRIAEDNLRLAYGDALSPAERGRLQRACWRHFGRITVETLAFPRWTEEAARTRVRWEGREHLEEAYAEGRGVLLYSAHFGHWELAALVLGHLGMRLTLIARPLDNPLLERMLARLRTRSGNAVVHKRRAVREMLAALAEPRGVAIIVDQDARDAGVFVPFFGRLASTTPTLATLALRTGAPLVGVCCLPQRDGTYRIICERAHRARGTGDREADVVRVTAECTAVIEGWVRRRPECWLWMHRRWKTRPPGEGAAEGGER